jgi:uncharacterized protein YidB (DUF937 family)
MGFLDGLENQAVTSLLGGSSSPIAASILQMIQNQPGGLSGMVQSFQEKGLGGLMAGWISTGPNPPMSTEQVHEALGSDKVKELAAAAGISPDIASSAIAQLLPGIVDKLTPDGHVPEHGSVMDMASSLLQSLTQAKAS